MQSHVQVLYGLEMFRAVWSYPVRGGFVRGYCFTLIWRGLEELPLLHPSRKDRLGFAKSSQRRAGSSGSLSSSGVRKAVGSL